MFYCQVKHKLALSCPKFISYISNRDSVLRSIILNIPKQGACTFHLVRSAPLNMLYASCKYLLAPHTTPNSASGLKKGETIFFFFFFDCMFYQLRRVQHSCSSTQSWGSVLPSIVEQETRIPGVAPFSFRIGIWDLFVHR